MKKAALSLILAASIVMTAGCGDGKTVEPTQNSESADPGIFVKKVENMTDDFITGIDISSFTALRDSGVKYYDYDGNELDDQGFFDFLHECGVNYVRIRVWNDPKDEEGHGYGGGNCDLENAKKIGQLATKAGMRILIDFHYSDFWADPGKQTAPKAWADMKTDDRAEALKEFTKESLQYLIDNGVDVGMVQIGNETNNGLCGETDFYSMCKLFRAGSEAVRSVSEDILVAVHFANPEKHFSQYVEKLDQYEVDYDVFASSYYPYWHGTLENLQNELESIAKTYNKKVMVAETSYVYTLEDGDGCGNTQNEADLEVDEFNFDISPQGQADSVRAVVETVSAIDGGIGVFYWEPAWLPVQVFELGKEGSTQILAQNKGIWDEKGSGWATGYASEYDKDVRSYGGGGAVVENEAWFDFHGHPLSSARMYADMREGSEGVLAMTGVTTEAVTAKPGEDIELPEKVNVRYNDGSEKELEVAWDETALDAAKEAGIGEYEIPGVVTDGDSEMAVTIQLAIKADNLLENPGFEDGKEAWEVTTECASKDVSIMQHSDCRTGEWCMKFWYESDFEFKVEQTLTLDKGTYAFDGYIHGGDSKSGDEFVLYCINGDETIEESTKVTAWREYKHPVIDKIEVKEDGTEVTLGARVKASAGCWGAWDDFTLQKLD
ncbi:glycosyl hydrolase 53 family protein [Butyrivibrio sp. MB2005]|uniref:glycosyl hydrolase 53 family protein n=1 Tax=Butyrivibrio sp. MB2005 TaxID=1280678 RepID=UPI00041DA685|nr:glycosyl hydrolase 53 family protein [Butyrivibrio sp. MB2005]